MKRRDRILRVQQRGPFFEVTARVKGRIVTRYFTREELLALL